MKIARKIIEIDDQLCNGCGQCVPSCAEGALQIINGKARVIAENLCDGLGACLGECPTGALQVVERQAEEFDEHAVKKYLSEKEKTAKEKEPALACGCSSQHIQTFMPSTSGCRQMDNGKKTGSRVSALTHWPIQIRLVPANASFLKNADLLVAADCTAVAYAGLHDELLAGRVIMMGCPKFDDKELYVQKFAEIFSKAGIKSITVLIMTVPCCSGLPWIVKNGMEAAGVNIPINEIMINPQGQVICR